MRLVPAKNLVSKQTNKVHGRTKNILDDSMKISVGGGDTIYIDVRRGCRKYYIWERQQYEISERMVGGHFFVLQIRAVNSEFNSV